MEELLASSYMFVMYAYILHVYFYISYWPHDIYIYTSSYAFVYFVFC